MRDSLPLACTTSFLASAASAFVFGFVTPEALESEAALYDDFFGRSVISPGDLDGDGVADLLVSAPHQTRPDGSGAGALFAFSGSDGKELYRLWGHAPEFHLSTDGRLAAVGDVDGDEHGDFLVVTKQAVILCSGDGGAVLRAHELPYRVRVQIAGLGDLDGDGVPDYGFTNRGAAKNRGSVQIVSGKSGEELRELLGDEAGDWFGFSIAGGMDADGDGVPDVLVGAPRGNVAERASSPRTGMARIHSGADGSVLVTVLGRGPSDCFGQTVAFVGDVNEDGCADFAVGAPGLDPEWKLSDGGPGYARLYSGKDGKLIQSVEGEETAFFEGERYGKPRGSCAFNSEFGYSLAGAGDVDGDGCPDWIVGARREGGLGGSARVFSGATGELLQAREGLPFRDWGHLVGGLGDLDGDGYGDFFHVGLNDTSGARSVGQVMLISGRTGALLRRLTSPLRPAGAGEKYF